MPGVLVQEWLSQRGGSENVLIELARIFPDAQIATLWDDSPERFAPGRVVESWMARTPLRNHKALAVPLMPMTWRHLGASEADWVLCSSHLFAHHAKFSGPAKDARKFVYAHTPARYIWTPELDLRGDNALVKAASWPLKHLDRKRAQEPHSIAANSEFVARRIEQSWGRTSTVIYPPVSVGLYAQSSQALLSQAEQDLLGSLPQTFILGASRFVPYKQLDVAIKAGVATDTPVVIAGDGPDEERLRAIAAETKGNVTFINRPSTEMLKQLYRRALVLVFPAVEDFGIMPVESMATGTPVIANSIGGASESVIHGQTGALLESFDATALRSAVDTAASARSENCIARAWDFDVSVFEARIHAWLGT